VVEFVDLVVFPVVVLVINLVDIILLLEYDFEMLALFQEIVVINFLVRKPYVIASVLEPTRPLVLMERLALQTFAYSPDLLMKQNHQVNLSL